MKILNENKIQLEEIITNIYNNINSLLPESYYKEYAKDLIEDLHNELYTVVVLGEFKRGKSTFVNALLGAEILPSDVTPTTATINAIMWNDKKTLHVHKNNGVIEELELNSDNLNKYIADRDFNPSSIEYIKIGIDSPILENNLILIDTPGVDDLNQQRVEVTYKFIPRADAVIFLLDSTNAVRRTEKEFIENNILKEGIDRIIFVANFIDELDEDEELEEVIDDINNRIRNILGGKEVEVLAISARQALDGILNKDNKQIESSGINEVLNTIKNIMQGNSRATEKMIRYNKRALKLINSVEREINTLIQFESASVSELNDELNKINKIIQNEETRKRCVDSYVRNQQEEMIAIVNKSVYYFGESLRRDVEDAFDNYNGVDFKNFIEKNIPKMVENRIKLWINQYSVYINKMLQMLESELAKGMARHFNTSIKGLGINRDVEKIRNTNINMISIEAEDISNTGLVAGAIASGTAIILTVFGASVLLPLVSMVGLPVLGKKIRDTKLLEVKEKVRPELNKTMECVLDKFSKTMEEYVLNNTNQIMKASEERYDKILASVKQSIEKEIIEKQSLKYKSEIRYSELNNFFNQLNNFKVLLGEQINE